MQRSTRIILLLIIDVAFFLIELIVGYAVGSLALVADSFHMLNDIISLVIALYAIKLTSGKTATDSRYSYGWHRAEILAALVNGVFLVALCFSISLEAMGRMFTTPEISSPKLVVIVGCWGLASNIVGLFLFQEHGHSHSHEESSSSASSAVATPGDGDLISGDVTPVQNSDAERGHSEHAHSDSYSSIYGGHPATTRASLVRTAHNMRAQSPTLVAEYPFNEETPLLPEERHEHGKGHSHSHSHSSGSMNMQALILHVVGDALGNIGVIAAGLIIWKTEWTYKYYSDPIISLVIAIIIFSSALPLVKSTSFILLQGVPATVSLDEVRNAILSVDGVLSLHELHVWQLSENKLVASVHVLGSGDHDFMPVAAKIRNILHNLGIHSSTIQPEYHPTPEDNLKTCLIMCPADDKCNPSENACCPPEFAPGEPPPGEV